MSEWELHKLGDFIDVKHGFAFKGAFITDDINDKILVTPGNFYIGGGFKKAKFKYYNDDDFPQEYILDEGDVVVTMTDLSKDSDTLGYSAKIPRQHGIKYLHNQRIGLIQFKSLNAIKDFLYWLMRTREYQGFIVGSASGTSIMHTSPSRIKEYEFLLPPIPEQAAIASILSSLDDKIDLLQRQNATLENIAETLFRQWFVEFSHNKGEKTYDSELGVLPVSFKIDQIKNINHILESGKRPKGGVGNLSFGVPSIGAESIKGLGTFDYSKTKFVSEEFANNMNKGCINGYELLIYKDGGTPGHFIPRYSIFGAGFPFDKMVINEHVFKLDFSNRAYNFFMYFFFQTEITESILVANGAKAAIPGINQEDIRNLWVFSPDNKLINLFGELTLPFLDKILSNCNQIRTLTNMRDTLLPKLMSGELKIKY